MVRSEHAFNRRDRDTVRTTTFICDTASIARPLLVANRCHLVGWFANNRSSGPMQALYEPEGYQRGYLCPLIV
jgi:hypothetical protein